MFEPFTLTPLPHAGPSQPYTCFAAGTIPPNRLASHFPVMPVFHFCLLNGSLLSFNGGARDGKRA
jgi:hypothetical protein